MEKHRVFTTSFASVYPHYVTKAKKKAVQKQKQMKLFFWLTGYDQK
ncbi:MAG: DUF2200 family protein [Bacteroidetes bacterium]|nr:DUF2200 family protein [Bacteroidota bacterium]